MRRPSVARELRADVRRRRGGRRVLLVGLVGRLVRPRRAQLRAGAAGGADLADVSVLCELAACLDRLCCEGAFCYGACAFAVDGGVLAWSDLVECPVSMLLEEGQSVCDCNIVASFCLLTLVPSEVALPTIFGDFVVEIGVVAMLVFLEFDVSYIGAFVLPDFNDEMKVS